MQTHSSVFNAARCSAHPDSNVAVVVLQHGCCGSCIKALLCEGFLGSFEPLRAGVPVVQPDSFSFNRRGLPLSIHILLLGVLVAFAGGV